MSVTPQLSSTSAASAAPSWLGTSRDEINGECRGRDICGDCNRTKNDDKITMGWWR